MAIATSRAIVNVVGVSEKILIPDYNDPNFAVSTGQPSGSGAINLKKNVSTVIGITKGTTNQTKEGLIGPYDPKFNTL